VGEKMTRDVEVAEEKRRGDEMSGRLWDGRKFK
jgi:hypothetical protein